MVKEFILGLMARSMMGNLLMINKEGDGTFVWENGDKYIGAWKEGKMHGHGKIKLNGKTQKGFWSEGVKVRDL